MENNRNNSGRFLCLGLIMNDILLENVAELPKNWEQTVLARGVTQDVGGGAANSARTLARLGADVFLAGMVGCDAAGERISECLKEESVDISFLQRSAQASTGTAVGLVQESGQRCFITVRGCNELLDESHVRSTQTEHFDVVHINGYFQFPSLEQDMPKLLAGYRERGSVISFDTASSDPSGRWFEAIRPFASCIDYFFANESQLERLGQKGDYRKNADFLREQGVHTVVAKRGADGCAIIGPNEEIRVSGYPVKAVDTTGAGDSFDAAFLLGAAKGWELEQCGRFANVVAALNCQSFGAVSGVPDYETALARMNNP